MITNIIIDSVTPGYATEADAEHLFPSDGRYSVVCIDRFKSTDDPEFIQKLGEFETAEDVILPAKKHGYTYYVYEVGGDSYGREEWPPDE